MNWGTRLFKILKVTDSGGFIEGGGFDSFGGDLGHSTRGSEKIICRGQSISSSDRNSNRSLVRWEMKCRTVGVTKSRQSLQENCPSYFGVRQYQQRQRFTPKMLRCPNPLVKAKLWDLNKIKEIIADELLYLALQDMVQNECNESQGERIIGTLNLTKFKGISFLLLPRRCTR